jgi:HEAT repeat protein
MNISDIQTNLDSLDPQHRMRGIVALKDYSAEVAVPLLIRRCHDQEVMIRSFVAMGLGYKQNEGAFNTLVSMLQQESDANVRAEITSALMKYGKAAIPFIFSTFYEHPHWLLRISILMALTEMDAPGVLFQLCLSASIDINVTVQETGIQCLTVLVNSMYEEDALLHLIAFARSERWQIRKQIAIALRHFSDPRAQEALNQLRQDPDYRVLAAILDHQF